MSHATVEYTNFHREVQRIVENHPNADFVVLKDENGKVIDIEVRLNDNR